MKINVLEMIEDLRKETLEPYKNRQENIATLVIIQVGNNPASDLYVKSKLKELSKWKIHTVPLKFETIDEATLINLIDILNDCDDINGIIVQLPLPKEINEQNVIDAIAEEKNVDGFTQHCGNWQINSLFEPCTPKGIMYILKKMRDIKGSIVCVIGRGKTVGAPLIDMLKKEPCTLLCCNSNTQNILTKWLISESDIVISAVGKPKLFDTYDLMDDALVIDAGISYVDGKQTGDYLHLELNEKGIDYTPHLNGVGKMTVAMLAVNTIKAMELQEGKKNGQQGN